MHMVQLMPLHPKTPSSLASFKSRLVLHFQHWFAKVVLENRLLSGSSSKHISKYLPDRGFISVDTKGLPKFANKT